MSGSVCPWTTCVESSQLQVCRARKDIKPGNLIGLWRALLRLEGETAHLTEWKWVRAEKGRNKKVWDGSSRRKNKACRLKEAGEGRQTGGGSEKELVRALVKRLRGVTENKSCRRLRDRVEMKAAVKGMEGEWKWIEWGHERRNKREKMSDGNREEACEAVADVSRAGGSEKKNTFMSPSLPWFSNEL